MVTSSDTKKILEEGVGVNESLTSTKGLAPIHYVHELPSADEERLEKLFKTLDRDGNGRIDIADLSAALKDVGLSHTYAEEDFPEYGTMLMKRQKFVALLNYENMLRNNDSPASQKVG